MPHIMAPLILAPLAVLATLRRVYSYITLLIP